METESVTQPTLTAELLDTCLDSAREIVAPLVSARHYEDRGPALNLEGGVILDVLVCKTLIPIVVAATNAWILRAIDAHRKKREGKEESLKEMQKSLREAIGQKISLPQGAEKEALVNIVKTQLDQFSDSERTARQLVETIVEKLSERGPEGKSSRQRSGKVAPTAIPDPRRRK